MTDEEYEAKVKVENDVEKSWHTYNLFTEALDAVCHIDSTEQYQRLHPRLQDEKKRMRQSFINAVENYLAVKDAYKKK